MTIHKSKGLEFDCVILPGLSTKPPGGDTPMLRWLKLPSQEHEELLLLSPMKAAHHENCLLYDYLGNLDSQKNNYEMHRLLYVAVTRAKKRLYLFDNSEKSNQGTFRYLLQAQEFMTPEEEHSDVDMQSTRPSLYHLPVEFYQQPPTLQQKQTNNTAPIILNTIPRLIGIVAHELLQWVCDHHPTHVDDIPWELAHHQLRTLGFDATELPRAQNQLKRQLTAFFNDPIGQWIIKSHEDERNEYELLVNDNNTLATKIIDRTFCDKGVRWIIDFKTGQEDKNAKSRHRQQLDGYAQLFTNHDTEKLTRCGLYYLENNHWVTWDYVSTEILTV